MKFEVVLYQETYTEVEIEADSAQHASDLVLRGEYQEDAVKDVTVHDSDILSTKPLKEETCPHCGNVVADTKSACGKCNRWA